MGSRVKGSEAPSRSPLASTAATKSATQPTRASQGARRARPPLYVQFTFTANGMLVLVFGLNVPVLHDVPADAKGQYLNPQVKRLGNQRNSSVSASLLRQVSYGPGKHQHHRLLLKRHFSGPKHMTDTRKEYLR